jgi:holliday junction DNA helicase RuvA
MIAAVQGALVSKMPTVALVQVGGVTLRLQISVSCFETLPAVGREVHLLTYLHVREDALQLYGFTDEAERSLFENLISVSGIGPRLAVGILSGATAQRLREGIEAGDADFLVSLPGVGKKLAQRLLVELRDKFTPSGLTRVSAAAGTPGALSVGTGGDATAALVSLGFTRLQAQSAVQEALQELGGEATVEAVIRKALRQGARGG